MNKRRAISSTFPQYFQHIFLNKGVKRQCSFVKVGSSIGICINSANLIFYVEGNV